MVCISRIQRRLVRSPSLQGLILLRDTERTSEAEAMEARARTIRERHAARERERGSDACREGFRGP